MSLLTKWFYSFIYYGYNDKRQKVSKTHTTQLSAIINLTAVGRPAKGNQHQHHSQLTHTLSLTSVAHPWQLACPAQWTWQRWAGCHGYSPSHQPQRIPDCRWGCAAMWWSWRPGTLCQTPAEQNCNGAIHTKGQTQCTRIWTFFNTLWL